MSPAYEAYEAFDPELPASPARSVLVQLDRGSETVESRALVPKSSSGVRCDTLVIPVGVDEHISPDVSPITTAFSYASQYQQDEHAAREHDDELQAIFRSLDADLAKIGADLGHEQLCVMACLSTG
jgi:Cu/Ag efflux pump CusA